MRKSKIYIYTILLFALNTFNAKGQTIIRDTISYSIIHIDSTNDSIVDDSKYPIWQNETNLIIEKVSLSKDTSRWTKNIFDLVAQWKRDNTIQDDGEVNYYYGLIKGNDNTFSVKKVSGTTKYLVDEVALGSYEVRKVVVITDSDINEVLCLFDKSIKLDEKQMNLQFINPQQTEKSPYEYLYREILLEKNLKYSFEYNDANYELLYTAGLSQNGYSHNGYSTINPKYFNIRLKLVNNNLNAEQLLFKVPDNDGSSYNISEIIIGDIDNDSFPDIIYKICNDVCIRRIIFLSGKKESNQLLKYIGETEVSCVSI